MAQTPRQAKDKKKGQTVVSSLLLLMGGGGKREKEREKGKKEGVGEESKAKCQQRVSCQTVVLKIFWFAFCCCDKRYGQKQLRKGSVSDYR